MTQAEKYETETGQKAVWELDFDCVAVPTEDYQTWLEVKADRCDELANTLDQYRKLLELKDLTKEIVKTERDEHKKMAVKVCAMIVSMGIGDFPEIERYLKANKE